MAKPVYEVLSDTPEKFKLAIYTSFTRHVGILAASMLLTMIGSIIIAIDTDNYSIIPIISVPALIVAIVGREALRFYRSKTPTNIIEITSNSVIVDKQLFPRSGFRSFRELNFGNDIYENDHSAGIQFTSGIEDIHMSCMFPRHRLYERIEVLRLLNDALQRIAPAAAVLSSPTDEEEPAEHVFL